MAAQRVVELGRLLGDPTRVAILDALFDGRARTVTELARHVGVAVSTTSEHLSRLQDAELVAVAAQGRHRYFRLAGPDVARSLESLFVLGERLPIDGPRVPAALAHARRCYDHLAGNVGVGLTDAMRDRNLLTADLRAVTDDGDRTLRSLGVDLDRALSARRDHLRPCLDWSERRDHIAGSIAASLLDRLTEMAWVTTTEGRALWITDDGVAGLAEVFGYDATGSSSSMRSAT